MAEEIYATFRFNARTVTLNERQYKQALADSQYCRCGQCLVCRVREYDRDAKEQNRGLVK